MAETIFDPPLEPSQTEEQITELEDETDELLERVNELVSTSETRHTELTGRIEACQNRLEQLSVGMTAENPMLSQVMVQLAEIRAELTNLKSLVDTKALNPPPNELVVEETVLDSPNEERSMEEPSEENAPPKPARKNRFL